MNPQLFENNNIVPTWYFLLSGLTCLKSPGIWQLYHFCAHFTIPVTFWETTAATAQLIRLLSWCWYFFSFIRRKIIFQFNLLVTSLKQQSACRQKFWKCFQQCLYSSTSIIHQSLQIASKSTYMLCTEHILDIKSPFLHIDFSSLHIFTECKSHVTFNQLY